MENQDEKEKIEEGPKNIQVVSGDGNDLDISPVYEHLEIEKPEEKKKQHVVVPEEKKDNRVENK